MSQFEQTDKVNKLIDSYLHLLTTKQQTALVMTYQEDMSLQEVADSLGIKKQTVHFNLRSGLKHMYELEAELHLAALKEELLTLLDNFLDKEQEQVEWSSLQEQLAKLNAIFEEHDE